MNWLKRFDRSTKSGIILWWEVNRVPLSINLLIVWILLIDLDHRFFPKEPGESLEMMAFTFITIMIMVIFNIGILINWVVNIIIHSFKPVAAKWYADIVLIISYSLPWIIIISLLIRALIINTFNS